MNCICFIGTHQTVPLKIIKENHSNIQTSRSYIHKRGNTEYPSLTRHLVAEVFLYTCRDLFHQCAIHIYLFFYSFGRKQVGALLCSYTKHSSLDKEHLVCSNMYKLDSKSQTLAAYVHTSVVVSFWVLLLHLIQMKGAFNILMHFHLEFLLLAPPLELE